MTAPIPTLDAEGIMFGYVVHDADDGMDFMFTLSLSEAETIDKFNRAVTLVHPLHKLEIRRLTGLTQNDFDAARREK